MRFQAGSCRRTQSFVTATLFWQSGIVNLCFVCIGGMIGEGENISGYADYEAPSAFCTGSKPKLDDSY